MKEFFQLMWDSYTDDELRKIVRGNHLTHFQIDAMKELNRRAHNSRINDV